MRINYQLAGVLVAIIGFTVYFAAGSMQSFYWSTYCKITAHLAFLMFVLGYYAKAKAKIDKFFSRVGVFFFSSLLTYYLISIGQSEKIKAVPDAVVGYGFIFLIFMAIIINCWGVYKSGK